MITRTKVISMEVDITSCQKFISQVLPWVTEKSSRYVCVSNVHMCIETYNNESFRNIVNHADIVVPDGRPIYWAQKLLGAQQAEQTRGMDITFALCQSAENHNIPIGFYGASEETLADLQKNLCIRHPNINIAYSYSPPFRALTQDEKDAVINNINNSGVKILFVGLGCPKQESWMAEHRSELHCVMLGVGAAFDFIAGNKKHAPKILQTLGLEWFYRLLCEPKRLWRRYLYTNPKFIMLFLLQLAGKKF